MMDSVVMLIILLLVKCMTHSSALLVYVRSDNQTDQCQNRSSPCDTLSNYTSNHGRYFNTSNIKFVFLPGLHYLDKDIEFVNLWDVSLTSDGTSSSYMPSDYTSCRAEIQCDESIGFLFDNIKQLSISGLVFTRCSKQHSVEMQPYNQHIRAGLYLNNITNLTLSSISVQNSNGYGIFLSHLYESSYIGDCVFQYNNINSTLSGGNAMLAYYRCKDSNQTPAKVRIERSKFLNGFSNCSASGFVLFVNCTGVQVEITDSIMHSNQAELQNDFIETPTDYFGGNMAIVILQHCYIEELDSINISIVNSNITEGKARLGGGVFVKYIDINASRPVCKSSSVTVSFINSSFSDNLAWNGGAVYIELKSHSENYKYGGENSLLINNCSFEKNNLLMTTDILTGIAMMLLSSQRFGLQQSLPSIYLTNCHFRYNNNLNRSNEHVSGVFLASQCMGTLEIENCEFEHNNATALSAFRSLLAFRGNGTISRNTGNRGGGIGLFESSYMIMNPNTTLVISHNHANIIGGGIMVEEECVQLHAPCFYQIGAEEVSLRKIMLINNTAGVAGSQIYGGRVDSCLVQSANSNIYTKLFELQNKDEDLSKVSSEPESIRICKNGKPLFSVTNRTLGYMVYSGEKFNISLALIGQLNGTTSGEAEFTINSTGATNPPPKLIPHYSKPLEVCSNYTLKIYTRRSSEVLAIRPRIRNQFTTCRKCMADFHLSVTFFPTPLGFVSTEIRPGFKCIEKPNITEYGFKCAIDRDQKSYIRRPPSFWLGYVPCDNSTDESASGFVFSDFCPIDYCKEEKTFIYTNSTTFGQDQQCNNDHSGTLCGQCKSGYSLSFGSSACLDCTHISILDTVGISLGLALTALFLLLILLIFDLTVTRGTLSGFLFYVNIVYIYIDVLLPNSESDYLTKSQQFFRVFMASFNLIFSCNCCLYDGLGVIGRTWIQMILVAALWTLTGAVIWLSKKSKRINKCIGHNAIPVLATIIILSQTSTNLAVLHALSFVSLDYPGFDTNSTKPKLMLFFDGNKPYFRGSHIPLFFAGCVFAFLSLSFTLTLLFIQPLMRFSHLKLLRWVNKLKPFFDAYTCPHIIKPHCRFWNGYLLLARSVVYVVISSTVGHHHHKALDALSITCLVILLTMLVLGGVYTKWHLNALSFSYILNLCVLSVLARYLYQSEYYRSGYMYRDGRTAVSIIAFSIAITMFIGTTGYHIYQQTRKTNFLNLGRELMRRVYERKCFRRNDQDMESCIAGNSDESSCLVTASTTSSKLEISHQPGHTHASLCLNYREPQLMDYDSI